MGPLLNCWFNRAVWDESWDLKCSLPRPYPWSPYKTLCDCHPARESTSQWWRIETRLISDSIFCRNFKLLWKQNKEDHILNGSLIDTLTTVISSCGLSVLGCVLTFEMLIATSMPLVTLPNTVCLLSSQGVGTTVMKNWDPLVLGPALAMLNLRKENCICVILLSRSHFDWNLDFQFPLWEELQEGFFPNLNSYHRCYSNSNCQIDNSVSQIWQPLATKSSIEALGEGTIKLQKWSPLAQAIGHFMEISLWSFHRPNTVNFKVKSLANSLS